jgi:hypothetical protein
MINQKELDHIVLECMDDYQDAHGDSDVEDVVNKATNLYSLSNEESSYIFRNMLRLHQN